MSKKKSFGQCLLTGETNKLVDCHIIPKALTFINRSGEKIYQTTTGRGFSKKWNSWYDRSIVTRKGEDILASIDGSAINILRRERLVRSGWKNDPPRFLPYGNAKFGSRVRFFNIPDVADLHRFLVSVAWRAAVSNLPDMSEVQLSDDVVEKLKDCTLNHSRSSYAQFPTILIQFYGDMHDHNFTPLVLTREVELNPDHVSPPYVRLYFDGLVAQMYLDSIPPERMGEVTIKETGNFAAICKPYSGSFQEYNFYESIKLSFKNSGIPPERYV
ncbi:hypothetical protein [Paracoccus sulfuroxidans]|uniref:Uncharacterized protein n=1 Tax=Paracoccus sulfuroxidans TaxID=384678 RepID=A0A562NYH1_9RHOB|nr:hypothetical protein [Paracoccus sulfuroxidans]TWI36776.1 hypothetical protein IQ24_00559 [Paracoccus sulfuroxidans]